MTIGKLAEESGVPASTIRYWERKVGREVTAADVEPLTWTLAELGRSVAERGADALWPHLTAR